jgi:hypothetical protein
MTIRYPDLQVVLPRSVELSKYHQQRSHHPSIQHQQAMVEIEKKTVLERQQVKQPSESEQGRTIDKQKGNKEFNSSRREAKGGNRENNKSKDDSTELSTENLGHYIDLKT